MSALEPEQEQLLRHLVEATHGVPRERHEFSMSPPALDGGGRARVVGGGLRSPLMVLPRDIEDLLRAGLLRRTGVGGSKGGPVRVVLTSRGHEHYAEMKQRVGEPVQRVEDETRRLLDSEGFREAFPAAYQKWSDAEALLWSASSERELSTIGHKVREATQDFANALVAEHNPPGAPTNAAAVTARVRAVIDLYRPKLGTRRSAMLDTLVAHWSATVDLIQRQEHGEQKGNEPLTWLDAWRVVLHTAVLMVEIAATLEEAYEPPPVAHLESGTGPRIV